MNYLIECGKEVIQWGAMIVTFGCGKQIDQALGFVANYINENVR